MSTNQGFMGAGATQGADPSRSNVGLMMAGAVPFDHARDPEAPRPHHDTIKGDHKAVQVEALKSFNELKREAKELGIEGYAKMKGPQLKEAVEKAKKANVESVDTNEDAQ